MCGRTFHFVAGSRLMVGAEIAFVKPGTCLFGEYAGEAFAIKIDPLVIGTSVKPVG